MPLVPSQPGSFFARARSAYALAALVGTLCLFCLPDQVAAKRKRVPVKEPDLKILAVTLSPTPYSPQEGSLDLSVRVQLPKELDGASILEVSSLISSPSKRSMRFLSKRQPVETPSADAPADPGAAPRQPAVETGQPGAGAGYVDVTLTWDGTDQRKQVVGQGEYHYEVRAKLLASGDNGIRTQMVSWPKRGVLEVK
ncbi:hypothetical protein [Nitrospira sp. Kam-Ns4a]